MTQEQEYHWRSHWCECFSSIWDSDIVFFENKKRSFDCSCRCLCTRFDAVPRRTYSSIMRFTRSESCASLSLRNRFRRTIKKLIRRTEMLGSSLVKGDVIPSNWFPCFDFRQVLKEPTCQQTRSRLFSVWTSKANYWRGMYMNAAGCRCVCLHAQFCRISQRITHLPFWKHICRQFSGLRSWCVASPCLTCMGKLFVEVWKHNRKYHWTLALIHFQYTVSSREKLKRPKLNNNERTSRPVS